MASGLAGTLFQALAWYLTTPRDYCPLLILTEGSLKARRTYWSPLHSPEGETRGAVIAV